MQKSLILLLLIGSLIGTGSSLIFFSAQLTTQDLVIKEENLFPESSLNVNAELDPAITENGVYVVLVKNFENGKILVSVLDPIGTLIHSKTIEKESTEERFEITSIGSYDLMIENLGSTETLIVAGIGHMPDESTLSQGVSLGVTGTFILIVGLIGIIGLGIYSIRNRKKRGIS